MRSSGRVVSVTSAFFALLFLGALPARAQFRTMGTVRSFGPSFHAIHVQPSPTHGVPVGRARIVTAAPRTFHPSQPLNRPANQFADTFGLGSGETLQQLLDPVPGLGFDYSHLAAIDSDLQIKAVIDPETEWRLAVAERLAQTTGGFGGVGYYLLDGGGEYIVPEESAPAQPAQQSQPTVIVLQERAPAAKAATESAPAAAPEPAAPIPDISNFTLVMRNGKKVKAIACTRVGERIVYITADGVRHSIAATELDSAATQRINEASGTQLTL